MKHTTCIGIAGFLGATGVAAGAFGAHGLEGKISDDLFEIFKTGAHYHLIHSVALLGIGGLMKENQPDKMLSLGATFFCLGTLVFSGSLYILSLSGLKWLGAITPIGGLAFILGWGTLVIYCLRGSKTASKSA